jgi:F-type H+-transporting ATPase subunit delta
MKHGRIAGRYAKALFDLAGEQNLLEAVHNDMLTIKSICEGSSDFRHLLDSPIISQGKKLAVFKAVFFNNVNMISYRFLEIIIRKRREVLVAEIAQEFSNLYNDFLNIKTVALKTAKKPSDALVAQLKNILKEKLKANIELVETINPNLVGGFVLSYEDRQYDASIRRNINRLKKEYNINIYESKI